MSWLTVKHADAECCQPFLTSRCFLHTPMYCNLPDNPKVPALKGGRETEPLYNLFYHSLECLERTCQFKEVEYIGDRKRTLQFDSVADSFRWFCLKHETIKFNAGFMLSTILGAPSRDSTHHMGTQHSCPKSHTHLCRYDSSLLPMQTQARSTSWARLRTQNTGTYNSPSLR
jgi:hypothetical protein